MNILFAYVIISLFLALVGILIARYFLDFRFRGDNTGIFVIMFLVVFAVLVFNTISLLDYGSLNRSDTQESVYTFQ